MKKEEEEVKQFRVKFDFYIRVTSWYLFFKPHQKWAKKRLF